MILAIFSLVGWLYLSQASALTTTSYQIEEGRARLDTIRQENVELELKIAQMQSMPRIESRARGARFGPPKEIRYIYLPEIPAELNSIKPTEANDNPLNKLKEPFRALLSLFNFLKGEAQSDNQEQSMISSAHNLKKFY